MKIQEYEVIFSQKEIKIVFKKKQLFNSVCHFIFCSRILHSLKPDGRGDWVETKVPRVNAHITGFPKDVNWEVQEKNSTLIGRAVKPFDSNYPVQLSTAIEGIQGKKKDEFSPTVYTFEIKNNSDKKSYQYNFFNRSRAVSAFCILWDKKFHSRDELELNLKSLKDNMLLRKPQNSTNKIYGDPSKTIDELRNQGFPRMTDNSTRGVYIKIERKRKYGSLQEHYRLDNRKQSIEDRVGRSPIPKNYRDELYKLSKFTCNNCGESYGPEYLSPDHRIPSIVQHDNLNKNNFLDKLQTLCVRCNQVKRESCKKCPYDHECSRCAWAYPEKNSISKENIYSLFEFAERENKTINQYIKEKFLNITDD